MTISSGKILLFASAFLNFRWITVSWCIGCIGFACGNSLGINHIWCKGTCLKMPARWICFHTSNLDTKCCHRCVFQLSSHFHAAWSLNSKLWFWFGQFCSCKIWIGFPITEIVESLSGFVWSHILLYPFPLVKNQNKRQPTSCLDDLPISGCTQASSIGRLNWEPLKDRVANGFIWVVKGSSIIQSPEWWIPCKLVVLPWLILPFVLTIQPYRFWRCSTLAYVSRLRCYQIFMD